MTLYFGPTYWWFINSDDSPDDKHYCAIAKCCPVGTTTRDGAVLICKSGAGTGWFVAPSSTQVEGQWAGGQYNSTQVGDKCCISEWSTLETSLTNAGFTPTDWFVPSITQLNNPGYICKTYWDSFDAAGYWSSTEVSSTNACVQSFRFGIISSNDKTLSDRVRAFRCVTY